MSKMKNGPGAMPGEPRTSSTVDNEAMLARLAELEAEIGEAELSFVRKGKALKTVWSESLHSVAGYTTFGEYVKQRWEMSRPHAYRLIEAVDAYDAVSSLETTPLPVNEAQCRELTRLTVEGNPEKQAKRQREAWSLAVKLADGKRPTQPVVAEAVSKVCQKHCPTGASPKRTPVQNPAFRALLALDAATERVLNVVSASGLDGITSEQAASAAEAMRLRIQELSAVLAKLESLAKQSNAA